MQKIPVITVDGPSGSGKGTISQLLAKKLQWHFLDSGAFYRVLAYGALKHHIDPENSKALSLLAKKLDIQFQWNQRGEAPLLIYENQNITEDIRTETLGSLASKIAVYPTVREALLQRQRDFRQLPGCIADGRDMGTVVFPDANVKFFLTASIEERAKRRYLQLKEQGVKTSLESIIDELAQRDVRDKARLASPMHPAPDAILIDTTGKSIQEVFLLVLNNVEKYL